VVGQIFAIFRLIQRGEGGPVCPPSSLDSSPLPGINRGRSGRQRMTTLRKATILMNEKCNAKKRNDELCQKWPVQGRSRCRLHGGVTPRGVDSVHYQHGNYSALLSPGLRKKYDTTATEFEGQLLSNQSEIRLIDLQLFEWTASLKDDQDNTAAWSKIIVATEIRRKLVESETKLLIATNQVLSKSDAHAFMKNTADLIARAVKEHVDEDTGRKILSAISEDIIRNMELVQTCESRL